MTRHAAGKTALGTTFRVTLYAADTGTAAAATAAAFDRLSAVDAALNELLPNSNITVLNGLPDGRAVKVGDDLFAVLQHAQQLAASSRGAFDVTAGPFIDVWLSAAAAGGTPSQAQLEEARLRVGWEKLHLNSIEHTVTLTVPRMRVDLSGIARGYAVDEMIRQFRLHGCDHVRVDTGDVAFLGAPPPDASGWPVRLRGMAPPKAPTVALDRRAIAFGGSARIDRDRPAVVNPVTGRAAAAVLPVAVVAPSAMVAQTVATAAAALGPAGSESLARSEPLARIRFGAPRTTKGRGR